MTMTLMGDSHCVFLGGYIAAEKLPIRIMSCSGALLLKPFAVLDQNRQVDWIIPEVRETFGAPLGRDALIGVSVGCLLTVLANSAMWRNFAPWRVSETAGLRPVSDSLLRRLIIEEGAAVLAFLDLLVSAQYNVFAIEPPPLKRTHPGIKAGTTPKILPELDRRWRVAMGEEYRKRGIPWIEAPREAFDTEGFLKSEYEFAEDDPHHANRRYAALIVPKCLELQQMAFGGPQSC